MGRSLVFLLLGAVAGAVLTHYVTGRSIAHLPARGEAEAPLSAPATGAAANPLAPLATLRGRASAGGADGAAPTDGDALFQALMAHVDGPSLDSMVRAAAASREEGAALIKELLLVRYGEVDPHAAMELAINTSTDTRVTIPIFQNLARTDPDTALRELDRWSARMLVPNLLEAGQLLLQTALREISAHDPRRATAYLERMPAGPERQHLLNIVAQGYGSADPDGALAWARTGYPRDANLVAAVIGGIAEVDPYRALDAALGLTAPQERAQAMQTVIMRSAIRDLNDPRQLTALANRLAEIGPAGRSGVQQLVSVWGSRDPDAALQWLLSNEGLVEPHVYRNVGSALARSDPGAAAAYLHRLPESARGQWMNAVAQGYAERDVPQAMRWLAQHRDEPGYAQALAGVAQFLASRDPAAAADLLDNADVSSADIGPGSVLAIASQWARQDPQAAVRWALRQQGPERTTALSTAVQTWAAHEPESARSWALGLTTSSERDQALLALVGATAGTETPDARVLNAFSDDLARQRAVVVSVAPVAQRDPAEARALINAYVTDPDLQRQAEEQLSAGTSGAFIPTGGTVSGNVIRAVRPR